MKKLLFVLLMVANVAWADNWRHHGGHYIHHPSFGWAVPVIIGGIIVGYEVGRAQGATVPQPVYGPPPPIQQPAPYGYHWEAILDASCNCYRTVAVPN